MNLPMVSVLVSVAGSQERLSKEIRVHAFSNNPMGIGAQQLFIIPLIVQAPQHANPANTEDQRAIPPQVVAHGGACTPDPMHKRREGSSEAADQGASDSIRLRRRPYPRSKSLVNVPTCDHLGQRRARASRMLEGTNREYCRKLG